MSDLTLNEQKHIRTALRYLRRRVGAWAPIADALHLAYDTIEKVVNGRRDVTAGMAFRVARLLDTSVDALVAGHFLPSACPRCGFVPDFTDEETVVEDGPRPAPSGGLRLVR